MSTDDRYYNEKIKLCKKYRILVVEDNAIIQKIMATYLESLGFVYEIAENGQAAISLFEEYFFDLVLLDWELPDMSGGDICYAIREMDARFNRYTPVILCTALDREFINDTLADGYFKKPFCNINEFNRILLSYLTKDG